MKLWWLMSLLVLMLMPMTIHAQQAGKFGFSVYVGYSTAGIGAVWHLSDDVALCPTLDINVSDDSSMGFDENGVVTPGSSTSIVSWGGTLAARYYLERDGQFGLFGVLGGGYARSRHRSLTPRSFGDSVDQYTATSEAVSAQLGIGADYRLSPRIGLFGQITARYIANLNRSRFDDEARLLGESSGHSWGLGSGALGLVFYLN